MSRAVIFLADGFEDIEALTPIDFLRRAGVDVLIAGVTGKIIRSAHNVKIESEICASKIKASEFDAVILPGGMPGATNLRDNADVIKTVKEIFINKKLVAALCAAPMVLDKAGILKDKNYTMYPGMQTDLKTGNYKDQKVVIDDNIITGAGPAAAADWSFAIIKYLLGEKVADNIKAGTLFSKF